MKTLKFYLAVLISFVFLSCEKDDLNFQNTQGITHNFRGEKDTLFTKPAIVGSGKIIDKINRGLPKTSLFFYNNNNKIIRIEIISSGSIKKTIKTIEYTYDNISRIITEEQVPETTNGNSNLITVNKYIEDFTRTTNSGNLVYNIVKKKVNPSDNSIIEENNYSIEYQIVYNGIGEEIGINIFKLIDGNSFKTFVYDNKFNVYQNFKSMKELSIINWETQKVTANNIISSNIYSNNILVEEQNYVLTYNSNNQCLEKRFNNILLDKYTY